MHQIAQIRFENCKVFIASEGARPPPGGGEAVKYEVDTGVRPDLQQAGAFGESTGSKNEGSLGESMIFGIQWEKNTKICGVNRVRAKSSQNSRVFGWYLKQSIVRILPGILSDAGVVGMLVPWVVQ